VATIRQRDDRWQAIIRRKGFPPQAHTFDLRKDAEKWATRIERELDTGEWRDTRKDSADTLAVLLERYKREVTSTKRGKRQECQRLGQFMKHPMAKRVVTRITSSHIAAWRDERLQAVSSGTVLRELRLLANVFTVAIRE
jgi:hypothetical protein